MQGSQQQKPDQQLELDTDLFQRLAKAGVFKQQAPKKQDPSKTPLDAESQLLLESGVALGKYLTVFKEALQKKSITLKIDSSKLLSLKNNAGAQTKLFNWNIITHELDGIGVKTDESAKIVAGDVKAILKLYLSVEEAVKKLGGTLEIDEINAQTLQRRGSLGKLKKRVAKDGLDILTMKLERNPNETESSLELILNTLCRSFSMKPKQAAALLTNNNQFLVHSIVKGVKGNYEPLISWYQAIKANLKHLNYLLEIETEQLPKLANIPKVMSTIGSGLYSQNIEICKQSLGLLSSMNQDFSGNQAMFKQAHSWVVDKDGGLDMTLQALKRHASLAEDFINFVSQFSSIMNQSIDKVYKDEFKKLFPEPHEYINVINDIFPYLVRHVKQQVRDSGILDYWLDLSLEQAGIDSQKTVEEKIGALTLVTEIWFSFTDYVDLKEERVGFIQQVLKKSGRDRARNLRIVAVSLMFRLLDKFAEEKNVSAPALYKALIFSLIENPADFNLREHYLWNFQYLFENQPTIPLNLLLEPLIKQITISENVTFFYKVFDFDFFTIVSKHPKLTSSNAVSLADLLGKVYLNDVTLSTAASVPLMLLSSRFNQDEQMHDFIVKFETVCLATLMNLEPNAEELQKKHKADLIKQAKLATIAPLALPAPQDFEHKHGKPTKRVTKEDVIKQQKDQEQDVTRKLKKSLIIQILLKLQNLKNEELNEQLKELLLSSNRRFHKNLYGYYNKGIMTLLRYWGDSDTIMNEYRKEQDRIEEEDRKAEQERELAAKAEKERREKEEKHQITLRKYGDEMNRLRESLDGGAILNAEDEKRLSLWDQTGEADLSYPFEVRDSQALMLYQGTARQNAATMRNLKAIQQIDKIARTKVEQEEQKRLDEERQRLLSQRRRQKLKDVLDKRKLELGVGSKTDESQGNLVFGDGEIEQEKEKLKKLEGKRTEIKLLNLEEEEDRDREGLLLMMKKYSKLWRNLYYKYSNSGFNSKNVTSFDQYNEKSQTISLGEMTRLLKDHNAYPNLLNKDELTNLFKMINFKLYKKQDLQAMDYQAYTQFIMQLAYFCFTRDPHNLSHLPPSETVKALIKVFEDATRSRGNSTVLYDDPDATSAADSQLIKALNEKLSKDPNYPVPEGYVKQLEKMPVIDYRIPADIASHLKPSKVAAIEVLDSILADKFGFHLLEPIMRFEERMKVKPSIKAPVSQNSGQAEALSYMKKVEKKAKPELNSLNPFASMSALQKMKVAQEVKPEIDVTLKLEVSKIPIKDRAHGQEVAEILEEILQAAEKGLKKLPPRQNRAPGQVWNDAKQKKEDDSKRENDIKFTKEDKRKKRDEQLKNELLRLKEIKDKEEAEKKKQQDLEMKKKKESQKKAEEAFKKRQNERVVTQDQLKKEEEQKKKQDEIAKKAKPASDPTKGESERKQFFKKQKERLSMQFSQMVKDREEVLKKEEVVAQKDKELKQKIRIAMETHVKETAPDRGREQNERKQINDFLSQEDVQNVFYRFDNALRQMFKFYCSQDKKDVGFNLERSMNTMNMRELVKFAYQQSIIPNLVQPDDIVQIFRLLIRERNEEVQGQIQKSEDNYLVDKNFAQIIDYEQFKKLLIRIATLTATEQQPGTINERIDKETAKKKQADAVDGPQSESVSPLKKRLPSIGQTPQRSRSSLKNGLDQKATKADPSLTVDAAKDEKKPPNMVNALTNSLRMSKEVKILRALDQKEQQNSIILATAKIDKDRKVRKEFNVNLIQAKTIEALFRFLELDQDVKPKDLDYKLNQNRIENQGQKPKRVKMQLKNNKLEDYIQEMPGEEEFRGQSRNQDLEDGEVNQMETQMDV